MRKSGILVHISSLPSNYGIGTFGNEAYNFIDFLAKSNQSFWQILPLGHTSFGDSPYQTFSAFAINPYFIDLDILVSKGLLLKEEINIKVKNPNKVDYEGQYQKRYLILKNAFLRFQKNQDFDNFVLENSFWLDDYALFMVLKDLNFGKAWYEWEDKYKKKDKKAIEKLIIENKSHIDFYKFIQYEAYIEWMSVKKYANDKNISIIGDMPIYVALDSSDVWSNSAVFELDKDLNPINIAGVPPDNFSSTGQRWGNPLYRWDKMEKDNYSWWIKRIKASFLLFDMVRIDHFIGFVNYYSIPSYLPTAEGGRWEKGPGIKIFDQIKKELGDMEIIAEDLGVITDEVRALLKETGFPGMKVMQFAFDSREESDYLPHNYPTNSICYTGTHDNETTNEWFKGLPKVDLDYCLDYLNYKGKNKVDALIRETLKSPSKIAIIPIQDYLNKGSDSRMNTPSTIGNNWIYRILPNELTDELSIRIKHLTKLYGRQK